MRDQLLRYTKMEFFTLLLVGLFLQIHLSTTHAIEIRCSI